MNDFQEQFIPHGWMLLTNCMGIEIELHPDGDSLRWRYNYGQDDIDNKQQVTEAEIVYEPDEDNTGEFLDGFYIKDTFYSLQNFVII